MSTFVADSFFFREVHTHRITFPISSISFSVLTATAVFGQENVEYDYEDEAPSAPVQRGRSPLLSSRQSKAIPANNNNKIKTVGGSRF